MGAREEFNQTKNSDDLCVWATTWAEKLLEVKDKAMMLSEMVLEAADIEYGDIAIRTEIEALSNELLNLK